MNNDDDSDTLEFDDITGDRRNVINNLAFEFNVGEGPPSDELAQALFLEYHFTEREKEFFLFLRNMMDILRAFQAFEEGIQDNDHQ